MGVITTGYQTPGGYRQDFIDRSAVRSIASKKRRARALTSRRDRETEAHRMNEASWIQPILDRYEAPPLHYAVPLLGDVDRARDAVQDTPPPLCRSDRTPIHDHLAASLYRVC